MPTTQKKSTVVLLGPGRPRVTVAELLLVASGTALLEWQPPDDGQGAVLSAEDLQALTLQDAAAVPSKEGHELLSVESSRAVVTLLASHLVHDKSLSCAAAERLIAWWQHASSGGNNKEAVRLPGDAAACATYLAPLVKQPKLPPALVERCHRWGRTAYAVAQAAQLGNGAALAVACLTVDSRGLAPAVAPSWQEARLEATRGPQACILTAAATGRALLQASRFQKDDETSQQDQPLESCYTDLPQYTGPCTALLKAALSAMQVELQSGSMSTCASSDETVLDLALQQTLQAVTLLTVQSRKRQGLDASVATITATAASPSLTEQRVQEFQKTLEQEAETACTTMAEEMQKAAQAAQQKEAEKQARAAAQQQANNDDGRDEFAGMSEAQRAKILRKRAEKEAKAAAKRAAKEKTKGSLFGTGTTKLQQLLQSSNYKLTLPVMEEMAQLAQQLLSGGVQRKPKIPKGTRDYLPDQMNIRQQAFAIIRRVFQAHGAVEIDTPVFELKETLTGKYGEDSKLIYDLADQGGEILALRYDLTVPFARFLSLNSVGNIKRFHIGKVYRRDQPALARGRYREFYQCDFDIAGNYGRMVPDSESVCVVCDILDALPIGDFGVKLNHRRLLDAILDICGVPADKFRTICSAIDKLDKEPWSAVKQEMVDEKGLEEEVADKIGEFVQHRGAPWDLYKALMDGKKFGKHKAANEAMEDLRILFEYLEAMDKLRFISFDLSLARGLDYYTGVIYEAVCMSGETQVGSIGGGGRYDYLVSMFQEAGQNTPCVGVSVGIERVFTIMEARIREKQGGSIKQPNVDVLVSASGGNQMMKEKMKIARMLWDGKISAEFSQQDSSTLKKDLRDALDREIPFMVIVGEAELAENKCNVKELKAKTEDKVPIPELVQFLRSKGVIPVGCEFAAELLQKENTSEMDRN